MSTVFAHTITPWNDRRGRRLRRRSAAAETGHAIARRRRRMQAKTEHVLVRKVVALVLDVLQQQHLLLQIDAYHALNRKDVAGGGDEQRGLTVLRHRVSLIGALQPFS